jgi:hypothetical protein
MITSPGKRAGDLHIAFCHVTLSLLDQQVAQSHDSLIPFARLSTLNVVFVATLRHCHVTVKKKKKKKTTSRISNVT